MDSKHQKTKNCIKKTYCLQPLITFNLIKRETSIFDNKVIYK